MNIKQNLTTKTPAFGLQEFKIRLLVQASNVMCNVFIVTKNIALVHLLFFIFSCTKEETTTPIFKSPVVDIVSVYSTDNQMGEANIDISEVFQTVTEVGVVWSEKPNPTTGDNRVAQDNVKSDQDFTFVLPNLQKGKTYYLRGFYRLKDETVYSAETQFVQNYDGSWRKLPSPELTSNEYISPDDVINVSGFGGNVIMYCYKVNRLTQNSVQQGYYKAYGDWNVNFFGNRQPAPTRLRPMIYNPIYTEFQGGASLLTWYGAGYQEMPQNRGRAYNKDMYILESNGVWEPYPGADAKVSTFGIGSFPYILENLPNGKLWRFDYSRLKWDDWGKVPTTKAAKLIAFDAGEKAFVLVEPENPNDPTRELYEYLPNEKRWNRKADFVGEDRRNATAFVVSNRVFFGLGQATKDLRGLRDVWEYSISKNTWQKATDYPGGGTVNNLAIGNTGTGLIGFGQQHRRTSVGGDDYRQTNDFWAFKPN
jgi:hypothetical protein